MRILKIVLTALVFMQPVCGFANPSKEETLKIICSTQSSECQKACQNGQDNIQETESGSIYLTACLQQIYQTKK